MSLTCASGFAAGKAPAKVTGDVWNIWDFGFGFITLNHFTVEATVATAQHPASGINLVEVYSLDGALIWDGVYIFDTV